MIVHVNEYMHVSLYTSSFIVHLFIHLFFHNVNCNNKTSSSGINKVLFNSIQLASKSIAYFQFKKIYLMD